ncbi:MAG: hypothetical protein COU69_02530 [Candidatus Pacebacteria bacterium CG10_big_fil_rev_8_21_14_0_10_56_10]|nr:MAG: hypothetical protein COU69_02530 [Candidatus Pacebacteria bacterium CG10_big_fil_rev_8_21_14_0_10_56_10]
MREHPIPQDITGYRFHIIGNMTIKQFALIATGVGVSFLLYQTNLIGIIKWPLTGLVFGLGFALAFLPFEERPLDHWLFTFFKTLYKPTRYYWQRQPQVPDVFSYRPDDRRKQTAPELDLSPMRRQRIREYLQSVRAGQQPSQQQTADQVAIDAIMELFRETPAAARSQIGVGSNQHQPVGERAAKAQDVKGGDPGVSIKLRPRQAPRLELADRVVLRGQARRVSQRQKQAQVTAAARARLHQADTDSPFIDVPKMNLVKIEASVKPRHELPQPTLADQTRAYLLEPVTTQPTPATKLAASNQQLPFPDPPDQPNKLVGMVLTHPGELVNNAIVEIKSPQGDTVRAVKTNALGQFFVTTPLPNNIYTIEIEKDDLVFDPLKLTLMGGLVAPLEIRSRE